MKYFDPARPRICNRPAYMYEGRAIAPLPVLMIEPAPAGAFTVTIMIVREDMGGSWHHREVPDFVHLQLLLSFWEHDPEAVLFDFGWEYREPARAAHRLQELSLDDIEDEPEGASGLTLEDLEDTGEEG